MKFLFLLASMLAVNPPTLAEFSAIIKDAVKNFSSGKTIIGFNKDFKYFVSLMTFGELHKLHPDGGPLNEPGLLFLGNFKTDEVTAIPYKELFDRDNLHSDALEFYRPC